MAVTFNYNTHPFWIILFCCSILWPISAYAETEVDNNKSVTIEIGSDEDGSRDYYLSADGMLDESHQIYFSSAKHKSTEDDLVLDTASYSLGIEDQADTLFNSGFGIDWWGNDDILTTQSLKAILRFNTESFSISLSPKIQRIRFIDAIISGTPRTFDINSDGWSASVSYFSHSNWYLLLGRNENKYYVSGSGLGVFLATLRRAEQEITDPELLARIRIYRALVYQIIGSAPLDLYRNSITAGARIGKVDVSVDWSRSKSLIGGTISTLMSASAEYPLSDRYSLQAQLGEISSDDQLSVVFSSLAITINW